MTLRSGDNVAFMDVGMSSAASRVRNVSARPLRMRRPAARVMLRASEIARARACVNSWRTFNRHCTSCCRADRRCASRYVPC
jgi:hypothetical protein